MALKSARADHKLESDRLRSDQQASELRICELEEAEVLRRRRPQTCLQCGHKDLLYRKVATELHQVRLELDSEEEECRSISGIVSVEYKQIYPQIGG